MLSRSLTGNDSEQRFLSNPTEHCTDDETDNTQRDCNDHRNHQYHPESVNQTVFWIDRDPSAREQREQNDNQNRQGDEKTGVAIRDDTGSSEKEYPDDDRRNRRSIDNELSQGEQSSDQPRQKRDESTSSNEPK